MNNEPDELTAVYYSCPWMPDWEQLAVMVLTFDRIVVPFIDIPFGRFDPDESLAKFTRAMERLERGEFNLSNEDDQIRLNMLRAAAFAHIFKGVWDYNVESHRVLDGKREIMVIADQLELATRGPRKEGFHPRFTAGLTVGVGGEGDPVALVPGRYCYSAGALAYATENGLPLLHDNPEWMATLPEASAVSKPSSENIANKLMIQSLSSCVPRLRDLGPYDIMRLRKETRETVAPFRAEMRRLAYDLRMKLRGAENTNDIQSEIEEYVKNVIAPMVIDIQRELSEPTKPWYRWIQDPLQTGVTFGIASSPLTNPAIVGLLSGAWKLTMDISDAKKQRKMQRANSLYFLVKTNE